MEKNEVIKAIKYRRSVRNYSAQPLKEEDLALIVEAGTYAPTGMNKRTFHFTVITDPEKLEELNRRVRDVFRCSEIEHLRQRGENENYVCYYNAPALVIVSNEPTETWGAQDCACGLQNIFLAAYSLGIASCWINQLSNAMCDALQVRELLTQWGIPQDHKVYGCAALGYSKEAEKEPSARKEGLITWIR